MSEDFKLSDMFQWKSRTDSGRAFFPVEYSQLWPDHEQRPGAGCPVPAVADRLSEHRPQGPAGSGGRPGSFSEGSGPGRVLWPRARRPPSAALDLAVLQYREGTKDFTTVLIAQQALLNEQDNLASTLGNISSNLVGVYRALGGGWEIREGKESGAS